MKYEEKRKKKKERKPRAMKTAIICGLEIRKEKKKITYLQPNTAFTAPYGSFGHIRAASGPISVLN